MSDLLRLVCEEKGHIPKDIDPTGGDPRMGGPVAITVCDRCGYELPHSATAIAFNNHQAFIQESEEAASIVRCFHEESKGSGSRMKTWQIPCPPSCPRQIWPRSKFKRSILTGRWKLQRKWRS